MIRIPPPWAVVTSPDGRHAIVPVGRNGVVIPSCHIARADAELIAAAPEMLELLEQLVEDWPHAPDPKRGETILTYRDELDKAKALIARVKGE